KRAVQVKQKSDALDRALGGERKGKLELVMRVDSLRRAATAAVREDSSGRRAAFAVRQPPYTIVADVSIPAPPDSAKISLRVALDLIAINARIRCEKSNKNGARGASLAVAAPTWARVRVGRVEQTAEVCMPAPSAAGRRLFFKLSPVLGVGVVSGDRRRPGLGYFFGLGGWASR
ncbi:MAG TPA: hypothetical protein VF190_07010, partial [Rhodothermales bacterium]